MTTRLSRRQALAAAGIAALGATGLGAAGCDEDADEGRTAAAGTDPAGEAEGGGCVLTPEQTDGPFYADERILRRDVREDRDGARLELHLKVRDATGCEPIEGATVEIWHADAEGVYSAFGDGAGETFLRGAQRADATGTARFTTVYPGWYPGRTAHVHTKVHVRGSEVHTGQLYFDDEVTDEVYGRAPYAARGERDVRNSGDGIYAAAGAGSTLAVTRRGSVYVGRMTLGVGI